MKTAVLFFGCMLALVAFFSVGQAENFDAVNAVVDEEDLTPIAYAGQMIEELHQLAIRATNDADQDNTNAQGLQRLLTHAKRLVEVAKIIKDRDVQGGIELIKKIISDFLDYKNQE